MSETHSEDSVSYLHKKKLDINNTQIDNNILESSNKEVTDKLVEVTSLPIIIEEVKNLESPPLRNYASKECNAKVLFANEEAENKGAVLNDKERDDYMRNPCERAQHKFLIIELCENIQVGKINICLKFIVL